MGRETNSILRLLPMMYKLSHNKFDCVIGRRRITIQPFPYSLVQFNM